MSEQHPYALPNSPGRVPTTAGAISLTLGLLAAALLGRADALLNGLGAIDLLGVLGAPHSAPRSAAVAILFAYPALYALSLLAEAWTHNRAVRWLGKRVKGSLCLLWSTLAAAILVLHVVEGNASLLALGPLATVFALGGVTVRWLFRRNNPSLQPYSRVVPGLLITIAVASIAATALPFGTPSAIDGLIASTIGVGAVLLFLGGARDVAHQLNAAPRRIFDRDALRRALRQP